MPNPTNHQRSKIIGMCKAGYAEVARRLGIQEPLFDIVV